MAQVFVMQHRLIKSYIVSTCASLYPKSELARRVREILSNINGLMQPFLLSDLDSV